MLALEPAPLLVPPLTALPPLTQIQTSFIVGGSGHRPHRLAPKPACYSKAVRHQLTQLAMTRLQQLQPSHVISGMTLGWDTAVAIAALKLSIPLICAVPFQGQERCWTAETQRRYHKICDRADTVIVISPGSYSTEAMQRRDQWIVHHSHHLLVLWNPKQPGGTANCVRAAKQQGVPITNLWQQWRSTCHC